MKINRKNWMVISLSVFSLIGCKAVAPENSIGVVESMAPSAWAAKSEAKSGVDHDWVKSFNDKELERLVDIGVTSAPSIKIAKERVLQAKQDAKLAGAGLQPTLDLNGSSSRSKVNFFAGDFAASGISEPNTLSLDVNWAPDVWGRARAAQSAVIGEYQAQSLELKGAKTLLAADICKAWFALSEAKEQLALAELSLVYKKETTAAIERRFEIDLAADGGTSSQLRLAQTDIATTKANISERRGLVELASRQLELLLGRYPASKINGRSSVPEVGAMPPAGLPSELLLRRPDILAAERRFAASGKRIEEARKAIYPSFPLTASAGTSANQLTDILKSQFGVWSIGASLAQPILTGGVVRSELKKRQSAERQSLSSFQSVVLEAFGEVESALASERWLAARIKDFKEAERLATEAATAAGEDYANGTGETIALFDTQSRRIELTSQLATLRRLRADNRVNLHLSLGGDFKL